MKHTPHCLTRAGWVVVLLMLSGPTGGVMTGCTGNDQPEDDKAGNTASSSRDSMALLRDSTGTASAPTVFDAAPTVIDSIEPAGPTVVLPQSPPEPIEPPAPPEPEPRVAGRCDVRDTEQFCFTYTGSGWTPADARAHCANAPESDFSNDRCPLSERIATCVFNPGGDSVREITYTYYAPYDPALAEIACPGEFTVH